MNKILFIIFIIFIIPFVYSSPYIDSVTCSSLSSGLCPSATFKYINVINQTTTNINNTGNMSFSGSICDSNGDCYSVFRDNFLFKDGSVLPTGNFNWNEYSIYNTSWINTTNLKVDNDIYTFGNVGIGASPVYPLDVMGTSGVTANFEGDNSAFNIQTDNDLIELVSFSSATGYNDLMLRAKAVEQLRLFQDGSSKFYGDLDVSGNFVNTGNINTTTLYTPNDGYVGALEGQELVLGIDNGGTENQDQILIGGIDPDGGDKFYNVNSINLFGRYIYLGDGSTANSVATVRGSLTASGYLSSSTLSTTGNAELGKIWDYKEENFLKDGDYLSTKNTMMAANAVFSFADFNNLLWKGEEKYNITLTDDSTYTNYYPNKLFDNDYETYNALQLLNGQNATVNINLSGSRDKWYTYGGFLFLTFYFGYNPSEQPVVEALDKNGNPLSVISTYGDISAFSNYRVYKYYIPTTYIQFINISVKGDPSGYTRLSEIEFISTRQGSLEGIAWNKAKKNTFYEDIIGYSGQDNETIKFEADVGRVSAYEYVDWTEGDNRTPEESLNEIRNIQLDNSSHFIHDENESFTVKVPIEKDICEYTKEGNNTLEDCHQEIIGYKNGRSIGMFSSVIANSLKVLANFRDVAEPKILGDGSGALDTNTTIADRYLTKSKVPDPNINYCKILYNNDITKKDSHYAVVWDSGLSYLDLEERQVLVEGCMKQQLIEQCAVSNNKYTWCK